MPKKVFFQYICVIAACGTPGQKFFFFFQPSHDTPELSRPNPAISTPKMVCFVLETRKSKLQMYVDETGLIFSCRRRENFRAKGAVYHNLKGKLFLNPINKLKHYFLIQLFMNIHT